MMRRAKILLVLLLLFSTVSFAVDEECYICDLMAGKPQSQLILSSNLVEQEITAYLFYENFSAEPPRTPIDNSLLFVYVVPAEGDEELLKMFTDDEGGATFDFSSYAVHAQEEQITYNFQIIYCPFCHPEDEGYPCGFDECVAFSGMEVPPSISGASNPVEEVPLVEGATLLPEDEWEREYYLPTSTSFTYTPPPLVQPEVPAFCFPILLIFALLAGAMYFSGKNPFGGFNLGTPRMGRHIRYTPGSRGMSVSGRYVAQSVMGGVGEVKRMVKAGKKAKREAKEKALDEGKTMKEAKKEGRKAAVRAGWKAGYGPSYFIYSDLVGGGMAVSGAKGGRQVTAKGGVIKAIKDIKKTGRKAKVAYKAGKTAMKPITIEGAEGGVKKGYGAQAFEGLVKAGGGVLSSNIFGREISGVMMGFVVNKDLTALSQQQAEIEIAKDEGQKYANKLDNMVNDGKLAEVTMDGKTYYEMDQTLETKDGKITVTTTRLDKEALLDGKLEGTVAIGHENYVEIRNFAGKATGYDKEGNFQFATQLTSITMTKGSDKNAVAATYVIAENGDMVLQGVEYKPPEEGDTAVQSRINENMAFVKNFEDTKAPVESDNAVKGFMSIKMDKGVTLSNMATGLGKSNYDEIVAINNRENIMTDIAVHSYYKTNEELKTSSRGTAEAIDKEMKKKELSISGTTLLSSGGPEAGETAKEHYTTIADTAIVQEGMVHVAEKYEKMTPERKPSAEVQNAGAVVVYSIGTDLASKSDKTVRGEIRKEIMAMDNLTKEEKYEAVKVANELYSDAKKTAKKWDSAAKEATVTYDKAYKITKEEMGPVYEGQDKEMKETIIQGATTAGILGYYQTKGAAKKEKHNHMQDEIAKSAIYKSEGKLDETPEQKFLGQLITKGTYQKPEMPEKPMAPEPVRGEFTEKDITEFMQKATSYKRDEVVYENQMKQWDEKQENLIYGDGANTALSGALVLSSAIQKGYKLPEDVYSTATEGIKTNNPKKWKEAAVEGMKEVEEQKDKKREKEIKSLKDEKELGL